MLTYFFTLASDFLTLTSDYNSLLAFALLPVTFESTISSLFYYYNFEILNKVIFVLLNKNQILKNQIVWVRVI